MAVARLGHLSPPRQGVAWRIGESRPTASAVLGLGVIALILVFLVSTITLIMNGLTPVTSVTAGLQSSSFRGIVSVGAAIGSLAAVASLLSYRRMPTRVSREQMVTGGVFGLQAAVVGTVVVWFSYGDVAIFAQSFLDFEILGPQMHLFTNGAKNTLFLAFVGETLGVALGLVICLLAISRRAVVRAPARIYINLIRGTPLIWQVSIIYFGFALGLQISLSAYTAAILAFTLSIGAYSAEVFRAGFQSIERGQFEAARGLGLSYMGAMRYAIVPQAVRRVIPPLMNEFVGLIKDTSLVLVLGLTASQMELFTAGRLAYGNSFNATFFLATGLGYLVVTLPLIWLVTRLEKHLNNGIQGI
jgi:polar amino acid transport system permease protein